MSNFLKNKVLSKYSGFLYIPDVLREFSENSAETWSNLYFSLDTSEYNENSVRAHKESLQK